MSGKRGYGLSRVQYLTRLRLEPLEDRRMLTVFLVDSLADTVADDGATTLREALQAANTNTALWGGAVPAGSSTVADEIAFEASLFTSPRKITLGGTQLEITDPAGVDISGPGAELLSIDANQRSRVFYLNDGATATLAAITVTGGLADYPSGVSKAGGGVYNDGGTFTIIDSTIAHNTTSDSGGGIFNSGSLTVIDSTVAGNKGYYGAGIYNSAGLLTVEGSTIRNNIAEHGGGGIRAIRNSVVTVTWSYILGNTASAGGGIYLYDDLFEPTLSLVNSVISGNSSTGIAGGILADGLLNVVNSTISGNTGTTGSGVYLFSSGQATLQNTIVALNATQERGSDVYGGLTGESSNNLICIAPGFVRDPAPGNDGKWGTEDDDYGDLRLLNTSPAIDLGSVDFIPDGVLTDLDENPRIYGGSVDVGAYEHQQGAAPGRDVPSLTVSTTDDSFDFYDGLISLREVLWYDAQSDLGSVVDFDSTVFSAAGGPYEIDLTGVELRIGTSLIINASGFGGLSLNANEQSRVLRIDTGTEVSLEGVTITGGWATDGYGGGIYTGGSLTLVDSVVVENVAQASLRGFGGGIYNDCGSLLILGTTVADNLAKGSSSASTRGGGIYNDQGIVQVIASTISSNAVIGKKASGGGIHSTGTLSVVGCFLSGNSVLGSSHDYGAFARGGGLCNEAEATVSNSVVIANEVSGGLENFGGAIYNAGALTATDLTVVDNAAEDEGGGIYGGGLVTNTIVALNSAPSSPNLSGSLASGSGYNLINGDPKLMPVRNKAGDIIYYRPERGSPAVDAGNNELAVDPDGNPLVTDCIGNPRIHNDTVDIGAVELYTPELVVSHVPAIDTSEGEQITVYVSLSLTPSAPLTVLVQQQDGDADAFSLVSSTLEFDSMNWDAPQPVTILAMEDADRDRDVATFVFSGADMTSVYLTVIADDNDSQHYVVDSLSDTVAADGLITLREALEAANTNTAVGDAPEGCDGATDFLSFAPTLFAGRSRTITLGGQQLEITGNTSITGPGDHLLSINANGRSRVLWIDEDATVGLFGMTITNGLAQDSNPMDATEQSGGGIYNLGTLSIDHCTISHSTARYFMVGPADGPAYGGGIFSTGPLTIGYSTIADNWVSSEVGYCAGGGIAAYGGLTISYSTIANNRAGSEDQSDAHGGGVRGTVTLVNSLVCGNTASGLTASGGGIYGTVTAVSSTIADNSATAWWWESDEYPAQGGGLYGWGHQLVNSIVALNAAEVNPDVYGVLFAPSSHNLIGVNPSFVGLGDYHLSGNSLAINRGSNALAVDAGGSPLTVDLDENTRILADTVDIGAYEYQQTVPPPETPSSRVTAANDAVNPFDHAISLREAIYYSAQYSLEDPITFASSLDGATIMLQGQPLAIIHSVSIDASALSTLTIDANHASRVFSISTNIEVSLAGLSITGGTTNGSGAGVYLQDASLDIVDSYILGNSASVRGGGIYVASGSLSIEGSSILGNTADYDGGGIYVDSGSVTILDSTISGNSAGGDGGGIFGDTTIIRTEISGNRAYGYRAGGDGGGICGQVTAEDCLIADNQARRSGGGIFGAGSITRCRVIGNVAEEYGGGLYGSLDVSQSMILENTAILAGGGFYNNSGAADIISSVLSGNAVTGIVGFGGGIHVGGIGTVRNTTIAGNYAASDGGGVSGGGTRLFNCLLAMNNAPMNPDIKGSLNSTSQNNLIGVWDGGTMFGTNNVWGVPENPLDPQCTAVSDDNGTVLYYRPGPSSLAVDGGRNESVQGETDLLGNPRIHNGVVEIGAVELTDMPELAITSTPHVEVVEGDFVEISVCLTAAPLAPITVAIVKEAGGSGDIAVSHSSLTFDHTNWNYPRVITLAADEDADSQSDLATLVFSADEMDTVRLAISTWDNDPQTIVVNSLADTVALDGQVTLREALEAANTNLAVGDAQGGCAGAADIIVFAPSLSGTIKLSGSQLEILGDVTIVGPGAETITVDADTKSRALSVGASLNVAISGLTITNGREDIGGGILSQFATLVLADMAIIDSRASEYGGALCSIGGSVSIVSSTIEGNQAGGGAGVYSTGALTIEGSSVATNTAEGPGGGIYSEGSLTIGHSVVSLNVAGSWGGGVNGVGTFTDSVVADNRAGSRGGGVYGGGTFVNCTVSGNRVTSSVAGYGGGIFTTVAGILVDCVLSGNTSRGLGGGIYCSGKPLWITRSTITDNVSEKGGGGICHEGLQRIFIENTLIANNSASQDGGGVYAPQGSGGSITLVGCTVADNSAVGKGGGIFIYQTSTGLTIHNSVVALNEATDNADVRNPGAPHYESSLIGIDPHFVGVRDYHLQIGSPAINAGDNDLAVDDEGNLLTADIDGNPRIVGDRVDIGAYEFQYAITPEVTVPGDANLDGTVNQADAAILAGNWGVPLPACVPPGDANLDRVVDKNDAEILSRNWGRSGVGWEQGDFSGDNTVNAVDAAILAANWGARVGMWWMDGDFDGDHIVGPADAAILAAHFGMTLP
ncbi:MAG TPA: hypothetical protein DD670_06980, partial [Planctomycetaceae bacterium]|nr:hypothetical protein [Planctomycetaceae bacterium]